MKHAYLIIAHHEFEVLDKLIQALDDSRNDIFIHFDKKVKNLPSLTVKKSNLYVLDNRIDIRWGHISQIKAEYVLFEAAYNQGTYTYYHLISGVHLPLQTQDYIHRFFEEQRNREIMIHVSNCDLQTNQKMRRYNLFMRNFMHGNQWIRRCDQLLWRICIRIQKILYIYRHANQFYTNAANWVSITSDCVGYLLERKKYVLRHYRFTLCGDEFFIPSELEKSDLKNRIYYYDHLLKCDFNGGSNPIVYTMKDYEKLMNSNYLFARKFSQAHIDVVNRILVHINTKMEK